MTYRNPYDRIIQQMKKLLMLLRERERSDENLLILDMLDMLLDDMKGASSLPLCPYPSPTIEPFPYPPYHPRWFDEYQPWNPLYPPYTITLSTTTFTERELLGSASMSPLPSSTTNEGPKTAARKKRGKKKDE